MFKKALCASAVFASLAVVNPIEESRATPIVPVRDTYNIMFDGTWNTSIYRDLSSNYLKSRAYQVAPQFLIIQDFDDDNNPLPQVDLYAEEVHRQWNDLSGNTQPFFNFLSPLKASDIEVERLTVSSVGSNSSASGSDAGAFGKNAVASGTRSIAVGADAQATGSNSTAIGDGTTASGTSSSAFGSNAQSTHKNSTAIGVGASTTRADQLVLGNKSSEVTIPSLSSNQSGLISADKDGTLRKIQVSVDQLESTINQTVPRLETAARGLGLAVQTSGAIGAAMSAVPEITLQADEPIRCSIGVGGYGSQYATAAGCALRIKDRIQLNGAISYAPSINYAYGTTSPIAGRIGLSFPLGINSSSKKLNPNSSNTSNPINIADLADNVARLRKICAAQENEIASLRKELRAIIDQLGRKLPREEKVKKNHLRCLQ